MSDDIALRSFRAAGTEHQDRLAIGNGAIKVAAERDPSKLPSILETCIPKVLRLASLRFWKKEKVIVSYWKRRGDLKCKAARFNIASPVKGR